MVHRSIIYLPWRVPRNKAADDYQIDSANPVEHMHVPVMDRRWTARRRNRPLIIWMRAKGTALRLHPVGGDREHFGTTYDVNRVS